MTSQDLISEFSASLVQGRGALFVGSGISAASGTPTWPGLLAPLARSRLGLDDLAGEDLTAVAQYLVNESGGNRGPLISHMRAELGSAFSLNSYHAAIAKTNYSTIWTTNQDVLLEQMFRQYGLIAQVKASDEAVANSPYAQGVELIKMHGSVDSSPHGEIVITQEDYEDFATTRPATSQRLRSDLLERSFLFVGYSYSDPNIQTVVSEARRLAHRAPRQHFFVAAREKESKEAHLQNLRQKNMLRFGIESCLIDSYDELETLLGAIALRSRGPTVYVTGSHTSAPSEIAQELGRRFAEDKHLIVMDGQSQGIGDQVTRAFLETCVSKRIDVNGRLRFHPNPYAANPSFSSDPALLPLLKAWRKQLFRDTHVIVFFDGGMGTELEIAAAEESGCVLIPGSAAPGNLILELMKKEPLWQARLPSDYVAKLRDGMVSAIDIYNVVKEVLA